MKINTAITLFVMTSSANLYSSSLESIQQGIKQFGDDSRQAHYDLNSLQLDLAQKDLTIFLENESHKYIIDKINSIFKQKADADLQLASLQNEHPLKNINAEELKKLHDLKINGIPKKCDAAAIDCLKSHAEKERIINNKKLEAHINMLEMSRTACNHIMIYYLKKSNVLSIESKILKNAYQSLAKKDQYEQATEEINSLPAHLAYANFSKNSSHYFAHFSEYSPEYYHLCPIALENGHLEIERLTAEKEYWQKKYDSLRENSNASQ